MSEQDESQIPAASTAPKTIAVTHRASVPIGDDGRAVIVQRLADGGYHFEWIKPDPGNGEATISTRVSITKEALEATLECLFGIDSSIRLQMEVLQ